jgi:hypothetical protein
MSGRMGVCKVVPLADVNGRALDVRFQGMNGLGPIGTRLIRAGLFLVSRYRRSLWLLSVLFILWITKKRLGARTTRFCRTRSAFAKCFAGLGTRPSSLEAKLERSVVRLARCCSLMRFSSPCDQLARRRPRVHRIPPRVRDDRDTPLLSRRDSAEIATDLG